MKLTKYQKAILASAEQHPNGLVVCYPPSSQILANRGLLERQAYDWHITDAGRAALKEHRNA